MDVSISICLNALCNHATSRYADEVVEPFCIAIIIHDILVLDKVLH